MREHIASKHNRVLALFPQTYQRVCVRTNTTMYNLGHNAKHITRDIFYNHCIPRIPKKYKKMPRRHFTMSMICIAQYKQDILLNNGKQT